MKLLSLGFHFKLPYFLWYSDDFLFDFLILIAFLFEFIHKGLRLVSKLLNLLIDDIEMIGLWRVLKEIVCFYVQINIFNIWILVRGIGLLIWNRWKWESVILGNVGFVSIRWSRFGRFFERIWMIFIIVVFVLFNITCLLEIVEIRGFFFRKLKEIIGDIIGLKLRVIVVLMLLDGMLTLSLFSIKLKLVLIPNFEWVLVLQLLI